MEHALSQSPERLIGYQQAQSPLYMVMRNPVLHQFISFLAETKRRQEARGDDQVTIELSRAFVARVRDSFKANILAGELHLHILSHVLASNLLEGDFELHSNVIGVLPGVEKRPFLIRERIAHDVLFSETDLDLGNQLLRNFRYSHGSGWAPLELSANFVEYIPSGRPASGVNRLSSRVKAEEELWNKVADELFGFDELVERDKHLQQFSKYIKDVFGIKIVCEDEATCLKVLGRLRVLSPASCSWQVLDVLPTPSVVREHTSSRRPLLEFVETKDYLTCSPDKLKKTGWKALKSVVRWNEQLFEIQIQPLTNYYLELDHMSGPSHNSFKAVRESLRTQVSAQVPLYGIYRDLLKMLFMNGTASFTHDNTSVVLTD